MRIVGGERRGLTLRAPAGNTTRPTADRTRQALFDMLLHAPWGGRQRLDGASVLDAFAGTGALGLEALSRGAATATFFERDAAARAATAANITAARYEGRARLLKADATRPPAAPQPATLVFLDPPYAAGLIPTTLTALRAAGWLTANTLIMAETGKDQPPPDVTNPLVTRRFGTATLTIWHAA